MARENCICPDKKEQSNLLSGTPIKSVNNPLSIIIFGASGDLTKRKLIPALFNLFRDNLLEDFLITGFARRKKTNLEFQNEIEEMSRKIFSDETFPESQWEKYKEKLTYHQGNFDDPESYKSLKDFLQNYDREKNIKSNRLFYLACDPKYFLIVIENLYRHGLLPENKDKFWTRVIIEKPFGRDLKSARELNGKISNYLKEDQIYRIDHYLGKETVQNILSFRFGNSIFEPIFNNKYVDHVQITVSEILGMEGRRGVYYDQTGALRDIVQNHILQLLALVALEPPASFQSKNLQDEKVKLFKSIRPFTECCVKKKTFRAQYKAGSPGSGIKAYREEEGVNPQSKTETYAALQLYIDNWRWIGVPFFLRTGKRLKRRLTEIVVQFKYPPLSFFNTVECSGEICDIIRAKPNAIVFQVQPDEGISLSFSAKRPGPDFLLQPVKMDFGYETFQKRIAEAYERLILDSIRGDMTLFPRFDEIEATWEIVDPILNIWDNTDEISFYSPGTDGPLENIDFSGCEGFWRLL